MPTSLTIDSVTLPRDLVWKDKYSYNPLVGSSAFALDGTYISQGVVKKSGRPMTLIGNIVGGWISESTLEALRQMVLSATTHTITLLDGKQYTVEWDRNNTPIEALQVVEYNTNTDGATWWIPILRFTILAELP